MEDWKRPYSFGVMEEKEQGINVVATATDEEKKWVKMLSEGKLVTEVAKELKVNTDTFSYHLANLRKKFGCKNSKELIALFLRNKLIE